MTKLSLLTKYLSRAEHFKIRVGEMDDSLKAIAGTRS